MLETNVLKSIIKNKLGIRQYPSFVTFLITWKCNAKCIFCDIWKKRAGEFDELNLREIEKIFTQLKTIDVLRITGGEPFLRSDLAEAINLIDIIRHPSMIHITTNGILTERILNTVKKIKPLNKLHIKVSVDDAGEKHDKIRGVNGAFQKAKKTIEELAGLRKIADLHVGINQAVISGEEIDSYFKLKEIFGGLNIPIYPGIAYQPENSLYSDKLITDPKFKTFGDFSKKDLEKFIATLLKDGRKINNFKEQIIDRYYLKGLYNRLIKNKNIPNPRCVALNSHLRILPNGDIPVCLFNGTVIGNLKMEKFEKIWFNAGKKIKDWIRNCPGCWQSCESAVNAVYTGDIWKGLFY